MTLTMVLPELLSLLLAILSYLDTTQAYVSKLPIAALGLHRGTTRSLYSPPILRYIDNQEGMLTVSLPSIKQVSTDSFTDQTYHASTLVAELLDASPAGTTTTSSSSELQELMTAQLSHQDGIRGFLAVYLTRDMVPSQQEEMPLLLAQAIKGVNMTQMVPLACMNVIRASSIACWHTDAILKENSSKTAERAKQFLTSLRGSITVIKNCQAVHAVASDSTTAKGGSETGLFFASKKKDKIELFWEEIFEEGGYDQEQRKAIAAAFASFVQPEVHS